MSQPTMDRRRFLGGAGVAAGAVVASQVPADAQTPPAMPGDATPDAVVMRLSVNGQMHELRADHRASLLDVLRKRLWLTGAKKGCDAGHCGACTVLVNGERRLSCLTLARRHQADEITTVEGLANGEQLHPMQQAFIEHDAFQCGACTPGQIMSAVACLKEGHAGSREEIQEYMSGNICRCGAYPNIVAAVEAVRDGKVGGRG